jgi:uncharacterized phage-associated protein
MYDARAVANFFLNRAEERGSAVSVMTLLKVLYFAHAWYLVKAGKPLIAQPFEAWKHGPVNRVVYDQYKEFGAKPLNKKAVSFDPITITFTPTSYNFDNETSQILGDIFDYYSRFHPFKLSHLTHEKGAPWDIVWSQAEKSAVPGMVIPNELIFDWFINHGALFWTDRERRLST